MQNKGKYLLRLTTLAAVITGLAGYSIHDSQVFLVLVLSGAFLVFLGFLPLVRSSRAWLMNMVREDGLIQRLLLSDWIYRVAALVGALFMVSMFILSIESDLLTEGVFATTLMLIPVLAVVSARAQIRRLPIVDQFRPGVQEGMMRSVNLLLQVVLSLVVAFVINLVIACAQGNQALNIDEHAGDHILENTDNFAAGYTLLFMVSLKILTNSFAINMIDLFNGGTFMIIVVSTMLGTLSTLGKVAVISFMIQGIRTLTKAVRQWAWNALPVAVRSARGLMLSPMRLFAWRRKTHRRGAVTLDANEAKWERTG